MQVISKKVMNNCRNQIRLSWWVYNLNISYACIITQNCFVFLDYQFLCVHSIMIQLLALRHMDLLCLHNTLGLDVNGNQGTQLEHFVLCMVLMLVELYIIPYPRTSHVFFVPHPLIYRPTHDHIWVYISIYLFIYSITYVLHVYYICINRGFYLLKTAQIFTPLASPQKTFFAL